MRKLTFNTFLKQYILDLSGQASLSIHKLSRLAKKNYRLADPLLLYCLLEDKMDVYCKYSKLTPDLKQLTKDNYLDDKYDSYSFQKINQSYLRRVNAHEYDIGTKSLIRNNILKMMGDKKITKYRIYTDLSLNPGNINDYLSNGNSKKVSLDLVKKIYNYCSNYR